MLGSTFLRRSALAIGASMTAVALFSAPAIAQKYEGDIVVRPPVYSEGTYNRGSGPNERVNAEVIISTRDLDLRTDYGVSVLQQRISDGARLACDQAENELRATGGNPGVDQAAQCYRDTRMSALREARVMVDYARG